MLESANVLCDCWRMEIDAFGFEHTYRALPEQFYARREPTAVDGPRLFALNKELATRLRLPLPTLVAHGAQIFSGNQLPPDAQPIALAYAGHQFGGFVPQLGDGRALLIGELVDCEGRRRDLQLKGAGPTPFSRRGDGRAALGPVMREYLVSEAMHALGIPTTRALAAVTTGESVVREEVLPGAVLTRVAASHLRVGTFEYFAAQSDWPSVEQLARYAIDRHYPELNGSDRPFLGLLKGVAERQAALVADWMKVGFIHGVMNTDNSSISGETIDYGPCAFMDAYDPKAVFSAIDRSGRYAFSNQPDIAQWNLARLAETLLPLIDSDLEKAVEAAREVIQNMLPDFEGKWLANMRAKIGLQTEHATDRALVEELLEIMHRCGADFTQTFRRLCDATQAAEMPSATGERFGLSSEYDAWALRWRQRLAMEKTTVAEQSDLMRRSNPARIPRNHRIEEAIQAAVLADDFGPFQRLGAALCEPYRESEEYREFEIPPTEAQRVRRTFCGT